MTGKIGTCLWFDGTAEEATRFYTSLFKDSRTGAIARYTESGREFHEQTPGSVMTVEIEVEGLKIMGLNGGPRFKPTPALSYFVWRETEAEIDELWRGLSEGGTARMELAAYPWAAKYGWVTDRFGVDWQLMLSDRKKIAPAFLFVRENFGRGQEALELYTSAFANSKLGAIAKDEKSGTILHAEIFLNGQTFVLMEGPGDHAFGFNQGFSLMVPCETQAEIDHLWETLSAGGTIEQCGWLRDRFGVSWQIVPAIMGELMKEPAAAKRVMDAILPMKKIDIATMLRAARGT